MTRDDYRAWTRPEIASAVVWEVRYAWGRLGVRRHTHQSDRIQDVVRSLAADINCTIYAVSPIDANGREIRQAPG